MTEPGTGARLDDVSIVVLSYNRREELLQNLSGLCEIHRSTGAELIVVDNQSSDGSQAELQALTARTPTLKVIYAATNLGVAGGRNTGWAAATRDFILNLDDDTRISRANIEAMRLAAQSNPAGIFTPKVLHALTGECQNGYGDGVREPANFHGCCHLVRVAVWRAIGPIDSQCTFGGEELDYSIRAKARGYTTVHLANVEVRHNSLPRQGAVGRWRRQRWVYNFTRIYFKHFPFNRAVVLQARLLVAQLASAVTQGDVGVVPSLLYHAARGMKNGLRDYVPLPAAVLEFYLDSRLLPDFGNKPLWQKVADRLRAAAPVAP